jgi:hypothetical protein
MVGPSSQNGRAAGPQMFPPGHSAGIRVETGEGTVAGMRGVGAAMEVAAEAGTSERGERQRWWLLCVEGAFFGTLGSSRCSS